MREKVRIYRRALLGDEWSAPKALGLTPTEERIVRLLVSRSEGVTAEQLYLALYAARPQEPTSNVVDAHLCHVRQKLAKHGVVLKHSYGRPYWLSVEDRARLREWRG